MNILKQAKSLVFVSQSASHSVFTMPTFEMFPDRRPDPAGGSSADHLAEFKGNEGRGKGINGKWGKVNKIGGGTGTRAERRGRE